jgi:hypothetical protein
MAARLWPDKNPRPDAHGRVQQQSKLRSRGAAAWERRSSVALGGRWRTAEERFKRHPCRLMSEWAEPQRRATRRVLLHRRAQVELRELVRLILGALPARDALVVRVQAEPAAFHRPHR